MGRVRRILLGEASPQGYYFGIVWWPLILCFWCVLPFWVLWQAIRRRID